MGVCGDAPAIIVNNTRLCSWMTREKIDALLDELK
jgi:NADH-quinone oxidoreductase subunit E